MKFCEPNKLVTSKKNTPKKQKLKRTRKASNKTLSNSLIRHGWVATRESDKFDEVGIPIVEVAVQEVGGKLEFSTVID